MRGRRAVVSVELLDGFEVIQIKLGFNEAEREAVPVFFILFQCDRGVSFEFTDFEHKCLLDLAITLGV